MGAITMLTADKIAQLTGIEIHTVRYRLSELRRKGKIKGTQFGATYAYPPYVVERIKNYTGKE